MTTDIWCGEKFDLENIKVWDIVYSMYGKFFKVVFIEDVKIWIFFYHNKETVAIYKEVLKFKKHRYIHRPRRKRLLWIK